jgi:ABC-type multidrug transport system fused ATPase/permease subunit
MCLVVASLAVPVILVVIAVFTLFSTWLFIYSMKAYKDCYRIESVTMSPILSFFSETFNGSSVIRAFGKEADFREHTFTLVNKTTSANQVTTGCFGWYSLRLDLLVSVILIAGCAACILLRSTADAIYLTLML